MFFQDKNKNVALELTDCLIRLDYWLSKNEKCIGCIKSANKKLKLREYDFQRGKLYGYAYALMRLGFVSFWHPLATNSEPDYVALLKTPWQLSTDDSVQVFIPKKLFNEALALNDSSLIKDILKHREERFSNNYRRKLVL